MTAGLRRGYADTSYGQIHYAESGTGDGTVPVLLLHQTPRSWREYEGVLPVVGRATRAIAMDTLGFGQSARPREPLSIELFAAAVVETLDALGVARVVLVGHHTGGVIAVEVAAAAPDRIAGLVLSATPYVDAGRRRRVSERPPIDHVESAADGAHLGELWAHRRDFYHPGEERFLDAFVADALGVVDHVEAGHHAVNSYRMEERLPLVTARARLLCGAEDEYSRPDLAALQAALGAESVVIAGGGVPLPEQRPAEFAAEIVSFIAGM